MPGPGHAGPSEPRGVSRRRVEGTWTDKLYRIELDIYYLEGVKKEKERDRERERERVNARARRDSENLPNLFFYLSYNLVKHTHRLSCKFHHILYTKEHFKSRRGSVQL